MKLKNSKLHKKIKKHYERHHIHVKTVALGMVAAALSTVLYAFDHGSFLYRASVVDIPQHEAFDGTTYPIQEVPDWVNLSSEKWDFSYDSLDASDLMDIPYYDPDQLSVSTDTLVWGDSEDNLIRNAKITYSVPYMGSYRLNGKEYDGSHLAVDIKIPSGTPIYAIANGAVSKASTDSTGFGHHIVIEHDNFPTLDDQNAKTIVHSSYSHLSDLLVSVGDVVTKGQQIALSGDTGTATTPHLHFQIDNNDAPWHPYWPFTWQEANDAGLSFWEAVSSGLGQDKAIATTINPLKYVQKYLDATATYTDSDSYDAESYLEDGVDNYYDEQTETYNNEDSGSTDISEEATVEPEIVEPEILEPPVLEFNFGVKTTYNEGDENIVFDVLLRDQYGNPYLDGFVGDIVVQTQNSNAKVKNAILRHIDFDSGIFQNRFKELTEGKDRVKIEYDGNTFYSEWFEILPSGTTAVFSDMDTSHLYYEAISYLAKKGVISGYPDGTFKAAKAVSRVEVLKFIFEGLKTKLKDGVPPFNDIDKSQWYIKYLYTGYKQGVVNGDPDGRYRPADTVNRAEFYKILFNAMGVDVPPVLTAATSFDDVAVDDWFAPYVVYAKKVGIIDANVKTLRPSYGMSRGEVAQAIYRVMTLLK